MTSVVIPDSVTSVEMEAFRACENLTSVTIGNGVTSIGAAAFMGCGLTSVTIGNSVTNIDHWAFNSCERLTSVTIPDSVKSIGGQAFQKCRSLTSLTIPNSVKNIDVQAFERCTGLTSLTVGNSVTDIANGAFENCTNLTSITIGNSVTSIASDAFNGCTNLTSVTWNAVNYPDFSSNSESPFYNLREQITEFKIGNEVTKVPDYLCYNMSCLFSVTIGNSVKWIGSSAFGDCVGLKKMIWLPVTPPNGYSNIANVNYVSNSKYTKLSNAKVYPYLASMFEVGGIKYVPVSPSERTCDAIDCVYGDSLYDAYIGNTVTYKYVDMKIRNVNEYLFYNCISLKSVAIAKDNMVISSDMFANCSNLQSVTIPECLSSIQERAFNGCGSITSITWNAKNCADFTTEANSPFYDSRTGINKITFGNNVKNIPSYLCCEMNKLKSIEILDSVVTIGNHAFHNCLALDSIILGKKLTNIGQYALAGNTSLASIVCLAAIPPVCDDNALDDINPWECTLHVPAKSVPAYQIADKWKEFFFIEAYKNNINIGDANGDSQIDVADFTAIASYILGDIPENFVDEAADVNSDMTINVADITGVSNIILYGSLTSAASAKAITIGGKESIKSVIQAEDFTINAGEEHTIDIEIENPTTQFSAYQFDMHLPDGIKVKNVVLGNDRTNAQKTNYLDFAELSDGITRVICASTKDIAFIGTEGTVARVTLVADNNIKAGNYSVGIDNVILSQAGQSEMPESITFNANVSMATGITETQSEDINKRNVMYDIMGRKMNNSLRHGIYIMNGKKIIK